MHIKPKSSSTCIIKYRLQIPINLDEDTNSLHLFLMKLYPSK